MPLNLTTPELDALRKLNDEPWLLELDGKTITRQDAFRVFEQAVREEMYFSEGDNDHHLLLELAVRLMRAALENELRGKETRGRPKRK